MRKFHDELENYFIFRWGVGRALKCTLSDLCTADIRNFAKSSKFSASIFETYFTVQSFLEPSETRSGTTKQLIAIFPHFN